jgi:hypothetical protein
MDISAEKDMTLGRGLLRKSLILSTLGMDILRSLFLATVVILSSVEVTNAAARKDIEQDATAPAPYGVCDLYSDAFFYRPGTHHCVRTSGLAFAARLRALLPAKRETGETLFADGPIWDAAGSVYATPAQ